LRQTHSPAAAGVSNTGNNLNRTYEGGRLLKPTGRFGKGKRKFGQKKSLTDGQAITRGSIFFKKEEKSLQNPKIG